ncbi:MAG: hypothetical protein JST80_07595 [Bdellovibrionales bacterium]|nr:hypothetical protein [Bdellovibrionales bacterium]
MSAGYRSSIYRIFGGLVVLFAMNAHADNLSRYYCQRSEGARFTDFAITISGNNVALQPYNGPESPSVRIYRGTVSRVYPSGNVVVDFNTFSQAQFLSSYPNMLFTASLFAKGTDGYARVFVGSDPSQDAIMVCNTKKIFY